MLEEARAKRRRGRGRRGRRGRDPRPRRDRRAARRPRQSCPGATLDYRGVTLAGVRPRRAPWPAGPTLLLVDELAHTNAPGSRHAKRWQDVEELLAAGISVYTTLNVQHLESLNDVVAQITGVQVRETVPDTVFDARRRGRARRPHPRRPARSACARARSISPSRRSGRGRPVLPQGQPHRPPGAGAAPGGRAGGRADARLHAGARHPRDLARRASGCWWQSAPIPPARGWCAPAGGSRRAQVRLDRAARRDARRRPLSAADRDALVENLQLADEFGAQTTTVQRPRRAGGDPGLRPRPQRHPHPGRASRPTRAGATRSSVRWWTGWSAAAATSTSTSSPASVEGRPRRRPRRSGRRAPAGEYYSGAGAVVAAAPRWAGWSSSALSVTDVAMVYLLGAIVVASRCGRGPSVLAALLSIALFDFLFVQPIFTFAVADLRYILTFGMMLLTALVISGFTLRIREQAETARERERRTAALYALSRDLARRADPRGGGAAWPGATWRTPSSARVQVLAPGPDGTARGARPRGPGGLPWTTRSGASPTGSTRAARWPGVGTATLPGAAALHLPLPGAGGVVGVLGVAPARPEQFELRAAAPARDLRGAGGAGAGADACSPSGPSRPSSRSRPSGCGPRCSAPSPTICARRSA